MLIYSHLYRRKQFLFSLSSNSLQFTILLLSSLVKGSTLSMISCSEVCVCPVCVGPYIAQSVCMKVCVHICISVHVCKSSCSCMNECLYVCGIYIKFDGWISNVSSQLHSTPWFHVALRCLISSPLLTKQSHIRFLTFPQTLSVHLSGYTTPETKMRSSSHFQNPFFKSFIDRNWSVRSVNKWSWRNIAEQKSPWGCQCD